MNYTEQPQPFWDAFAKLREASNSFLMSVSPSVRMELGSKLNDFREIWYLHIFRKPLQKIQVP